MKCYNLHVLVFCTFGGFGIGVFINCDFSSVCSISFSPVLKKNYISDWCCTEDVKVKK